MKARMIVLLCCAALALALTACEGGFRYGSACEEAYEDGVAEVCNYLRRNHSDVHRQLRRDRVCF